VITGQKIFITLGSWANPKCDRFARTGEPGPRASHASSFPADAQARGAPIHGSSGWRAGHRGAFLDGRPRSGRERRGESARLQGRDVASTTEKRGISLGAGCVGIAQGCLDGQIGRLHEGAQASSRRASRASS